MIRLDIRKVKTASILLLAMPILLFLALWLRPVWALPAAALFAASVIRYIKTLGADREGCLLVHTKDFVLAILCCALFVWLTGLGGGYYQTWDNHARNAIFRDLIRQPWPVIYEGTGNALVYYHIFWMWPALIGKVFGWGAANIALYLQGVCFAVVVVLNISIYLERKGIRNKLTMIAFVFIIWSGLNIVGQAFSQTVGWCNTVVSLGTNEGWLDFSRNGFDSSYLYRSNYDAVCQVYNQAFPAWLSMLVYLNDRSTSRCAWIGLCLLPYGPIPFIGLFVMIAVYETAKGIAMIRSKKTAEMMKQFCSFENVAAILMAVIFLMYFSCSIAGTHMSGYVPLEQYDFQRILTLCMFYFFEFGIYALTIRKEHSRDILFWTANLSLLLIPLVKVGYGRDFCMNASLPALMLIMVYVIESICRCAAGGKRCSRKLAVLCICLSFSALTPLFGILEKVYIMKNEHRFPYVADLAYSYSNRDLQDVEYDPANYLCPEPDGKFFYKYLAKK